MKVIVKASLILAAMVAGNLMAEDFFWTGAESACWTNKANWVDSSGNPVGRCPGVAKTQDESADWAALRIEADRAFFSRSSSRTTIDLDGLFAISSIVFRGGDTPSYILGTGAEQQLPIRQSGSVSVESTVVNMPSIAASILYPIGASANWTALTFTNSASGELAIAGFVTGIQDPEAGLAFMSAQLTFAGTGGYRIFGSGIANVDVYATTSGKIRIAGDMINVRRLYFSGTKSMEIEAGCNFYSSKNLDHKIDLTGAGGKTVDVFGDGTFHLLSKTNNKQFFESVSGHLVFNCPVTVDNNTWGGMTLKTGSGGSVEFKNTISKLNNTVEVTAPVAFRAASIGANASASQAGTGSLVYLKSGGALEYTGAGETTTRNLEIAGGIGALVNSGTGAWTVSSPIAVSAASTLKLGGDSAVAATLTSDVAHDSLAFVKAGTGTWTLSGDVDVTTTASLEGGKLVLTATSKDAFAGASGLTVKGRATLEFAPGIETASLPQLTAGANGGTVVVPDGCTVALTAAPVADGGVVDVDLRGTGKVVCSSAAGTVTACLTVGGVAGVFNADGELVGDKYPSISTVVAARGGVIQDDSTAQVAIAQPGDPSAGPVTLEKESTSVSLLVQKEAVPATVSLAGGTFGVGTLSMLGRTGGLTVGAQAGDGVLQAGETLTLENFNPSAQLTVNATLTAAMDGSKLDKTGSGDAAVMEMAGTWSAEPTEGRLTLSGTGDFALTGTVSGGARLAFAGLANIADAPAANTVSGFLVGKAGPGILEIGPGTALTNRLYVGCGGCGAVYQTGGFFYNRYVSGDTDQYRPGIGYNGYGYYELRDGVYAEGGGTRQMCATKDSVGVLDIYGGAVMATGTDQLWLNAKSGATGIIVVRGGSYEVKGLARVPDSTGVFCLTQEGVDSVVGFNSLLLGFTSGNSTSVFNLNGGVFSAEEICRKSGSGMQAVFNFNGGTMRAKSDKALFRTGTSGTMSSTVLIDHLVSYGRGATFDTAGNNVNLGMPLEAPTGSGVASVGWTAADAAEKYIGAPAILISGDGFGATACADFDSLSGCVTNIRVTCSGSGYTEGNVTATLKYNSTSRTLPVTLGPVVPGGVVKKGNGTLTLDQVNTYVGETAVEGGTLRAGVAGAIPSGGALRLDGGTLDLNGQTPTFSGICGAGGTVVNGTVTIAGEWTVDAAGIGEKTSLNGDLAFADGASIRVTSTESLDPAVCKRYTLVRATGGHAITGTPAIVGSLPEGWRVGVSPESVTLSHSEAFILIFK